MCSFTELEKKIIDAENTHGIDAENNQQIKDLKEILNLTNYLFNSNETIDSFQMECSALNNTSEPITDIDPVTVPYRNKNFSLYRTVGSKKESLPYVLFEDINIIIEINSTKFDIKSDYLWSN